ncbi:Oidioi.mRNA.OKI2018_I69.chr1.g805.t1.cds [Oikopleura dioica]|uniref:Oidioi.mRNA.OKI2018_I69.chr1.g805.t1.cds n=1 Tax=Oikopleura dioica TaxID=34765 RepID=A0ABN7SQA6_OIKDI|nr:Oidioi.mRNA.OKI2018_I69.chr1.g805.t1.cds [Oikopleura dioica]
MRVLSNFVVAVFGQCDLFPVDYGFGESIYHRAEYFLRNRCHRTLNDGDYHKFGALTDFALGGTGYYRATGLKGKVDNLLNLPLTWEETMKKKYSVGVITGFQSPFVEMGKVFELNSASVAGFVNGIIWTDHALKSYREKSEWDIMSDFEMTNLLDEAVDDMYAQFESIFRGGFLDPQELTIHYAQILLNGYWLVTTDGVLGLIEFVAFLGDKFFSWLPSIMTANIYELIIIVEEIIVSIQNLVNFFMTTDTIGDFFPKIHDLFSGFHRFFRKSVLSLIDLQVLAKENNKNFRQYGLYGTECEPFAAFLCPIQTAFPALEDAIIFINDLYESFFLIVVDFTELILARDFIDFLDSVFVTVTMTTWIAAFPMRFYEEAILKIPALFETATATPTVTTTASIATTTALATTTVL